MKRVLLLLLVLAARTATLPAAQVQLAVNTNTSTLQLTLCVQGTCDTEISTLRGGVTFGLDSDPTQIALRNFDLRANSDYAFHLDYGFLLGDIFANVRNLRVYHAEPGPQQPFFPLTAGSYTFTNVPFLTSGTADYVAQGLICGVIQGLGLPCNDNRDLATLGTGRADTISGTIQIVGETVQADLIFDFNLPLDPANPGTGNIAGHAVIHASGPLHPPLVPAGSVWKYRDNGLDEGTAWHMPGYDDNHWTNGPAQLGYGDNDEATVVSFGPEATNKFITTYFRHTFDVPEPGSLTNLTVRLLRDDGGIVYLNGVEIFRSNMPTGAVDYLTLAGAATLSETLSFAGTVNPALLMQGPNVLAVEIHQNAPGSSDLSFDLELFGNGGFSNALPVVTITSPAHGAATLPGTVAITTASSDPDGVVALTEFFANGIQIGETINTPFNWTGVPPGAYVLTARATDNSGQSAVSPPVTLIVAKPPVSVVSTGAVWRYFDKGADLGTAWRSVNFPDGGWSNGLAPLGYGDGDEATVVGFGTNSANKYITTYFRRAFTVTNAAAIVTASVRVLRDDGAVVYLNGTEVYRNNMPTGAVSFITLASTNVATGSEESSQFYGGPVPRSLFVNGVNVIAVEVHQASTNSSDLSFNLELLAASTNALPTVALTAPPANAALPAGADNPLAATAADPDGAIVRVEFYDGSVLLGQDTGAPFSLMWSNPPAGEHALTARAFDDSGSSTLSAPVIVQVGRVAFIPAGAVWKYLDNGTDQGAGWRAINFPDGAWPSGPAQLGYGEGDEATRVEDNATAGYNAADTNRYITTYFRRAFTVADTAFITNVTVRLLRDDGAMVYLNNTIIIRSNMPNGAVNYLTPAASAVGGADESTFYPTAVNPALLQTGVNVIAVELHQSGPGSSDTSFDLELVAELGVPVPRLAIAPAVGAVVLSWPAGASGFKLETSSSLGGVNNWSSVTNNISTFNNEHQVTLPRSALQEFFRLRRP